MEFSIAPKDADGFPIVVASGPITVESAIELGRFIRAECDATGTKGAVVDCGDIKGALSPVDLYEMTPAFTNVVGRSIRVAYINPPDHWSPADDQFSRDLAHNRGGLLELFESVEDAVAWIRAI